MSQMNQLPNILAQRYASEKMCEIWLAKTKATEERKLWVEILKAQKELGLTVSGEEISDKDISAYEKKIEKVDLDSINRREDVLGHDLKARLEEFTELAGVEKIHLGLTSRDITENIEQKQIYSSSLIIFDTAKKCLEKIAELVKEHKSVLMVGRTHNVPAQITTLGRRFAIFGEELLLSIDGLQDFLSRYRFRGIKGAIGTQSDLLDLFGGDESGAERASMLDEKITEYLTADILAGSDSKKPAALTSVGQIYPRSADLAFAHQMVQIISGPANFALNLRLMAGAGLANEGLHKDRVGSSAMPHKANPSLCERISGLAVLTRGYMGMLAELAGQQWNEGDVSCSVVRRVALPDICFATEGALTAFLDILDNIHINQPAIEAEVQVNLPFLSSSRLLTGAVQAGMGREKAHKIIKDKSIQARAETESSPAGAYSLQEHPLINHLDEAGEFPLNKIQMLEIIQKEPLPGRAAAQVEEFLALFSGFYESGLN